MFELFIDAQTQKGIQRLNDYKNAILLNELGWKKTKKYKIDRISKKIGMTIKTYKYLITAC